MELLSYLKLEHRIYALRAVHGDSTEKNTPKVGSKVSKGNENYFKSTVEVITDKDTSIEIEDIEENCINYNKVTSPPRRL